MSQGRGCGEKYPNNTRLLYLEVQPHQGVSGLKGLRLGSTWNSSVKNIQADVCREEQK